MSDQPLLYDSFDPEPLPHWNRYVLGHAVHELTAEGIRLTLDHAHPDHYSNSQLDDFHGRHRDDFLWKPPVRLHLRARFSHPSSEIPGTAGFGWWNAPFIGGRATEVDVGPQVLWFLYASAPSSLAATPRWEGTGWAAQGLNAPTLPGLLVKAGMFALRLPGLKTLARLSASGVSRASEQPLPDLDITSWHEYTIEWREERADFLVDGEHVLRYERPPRGPLALVLWMDNQWANMEGAGGLLNVPQRQWLELADVRVDEL